MIAARSVVEIYDQYRQQDIIDRDIYRAALKGITRKNLDFAAVWGGWEPNALDGQDARYQNTKGTDESGRFIDLWYLNDQGSLAIRALKIQKGETADWYDGPRRSKTEVITEPYEMDLQMLPEKITFLATSVVVPVLAEGKFLGTVGVDFNMSDIQQKIAEIHPYERGYVSLVTHQGEIVSIPIQELQKQTHLSANRISGISETIFKIQEISTVIAAAIEQQGAATQEISRNVLEVSQRAGDVTNNIIHVHQDSDHAAKVASTFLVSANSLKIVSDQSNQEVGNFVDEIRQNGIN